MGNLPTIVRLTPWEVPEALSQGTVRSLTRDTGLSYIRTKLYVDGLARSGVRGTGVLSVSVSSDAFVPDHYLAASGGDNGNDGLTAETPWATMAYAKTQMGSGESLGFLNGSYSEAIGAVSAGVTFRAVNDGQATLTGAFDTGSAVGHIVQGFKVVRAETKILGANGTFRRMSFVGGKIGSCGSGDFNVGFGGDNIAVYESAIYGAGGRYLFSPWQKDGIYLEDIIMRMQGGGTYDGSNPFATMNFYDSTRCELKRGIAIDGWFESGPPILGGLGCNCHTTNQDAGLFTECVCLNTETGRFWTDGGGTANGIIITDCVESGNEEGSCVSCNCQHGDVSVVRMLSDDYCQVFQGGSVTHTNSLIASGGTDCTGTISGDGANLTLNTEFLNDARWATEMNTLSGTGWYDSGLSLGAYVQAAIDAI